MPKANASISTVNRSGSVLARKIRRISALLEREYGPKVWNQTDDPLSQLVKTILSQNTTDTNSLRAFQRLRERFPTWPQVLQAPRRQVVETILSGGLAEIKARRIREIIGQICREHPRCDLSFLKDWPTDRIREYLGGFVGVGEKTVACVLLFALGRPVMPVDTHVRRVSQRLGLIPQGTDAARAHTLLQSAVPPELVYGFHLNLIQHGRRICKARGPACRRCVLRRRCPAYPLFTERSH